MSPIINKQFRLAARPVGAAKRSDWSYEEVPVGQPGDGEVLVKVRYISLDPAMRGWMNEGRSYIRPVGLGEVMRAAGVGEVVASRDPGFAPGDTVSGSTGVQSYALVQGKDLLKIDTRTLPAQSFLNALGMPGMTAYFGLLEVGLPKPGDTVVVSAATGAVGQVVGQIAKIKGCRAVGIAGGTEKCDFAVKALGFDACIDYKAGPIHAGLAEHCPKGVDVYFDNVGGEILDAVLGRLALRARVVICGAISQYNNPQAIVGPKNYLSLLVNRARMEGMVVFDWAPRYAEAVKEMAPWILSGRLKTKEDIVQGIETFPETLLRLFSGENFGKLILEV